MTVLVAGATGLAGSAIVDELEKNGRIGGIIKYCLERYMSDENSFEKIIELSNRECRRIKVGRVLILSSTKKENGNYTF